MENKFIHNLVRDQFELEVMNFINGNCENDEILVPMPFNLTSGDAFFAADGYLPKGCGKLRFPVNTIIEVKFRILPDTISRWVNKIQASFRKEDKYTFVLIHNSHLQQENWKLKVQGNDIRIINFDTLKGTSNSQFEIDSEIRERFKKKTEKEIDKLLNILKSSSNKGNLTLFLGAGVSVSGGLPSWDKLLANLVQEINPEGKPTILSQNHLPRIKEASNNSAIIMARYMRVGKNHSPMIQKPLNDNPFNKALHSALFSGIPNYQDRPLINSIVSLIERRKAKAVITYNFDDYLESSLDLKGIPYQTIAEGGRLEAGNFPIYHVHGFLPLNQNNPNIPNPVLTEESYHSLYQDAYQWSNVEQLHALNNTTCVFIGLSMNDPNLRRLMEISMMKNETDNEIAPHFVFLRKTKLYENTKDHTQDSTEIEDTENRQVIESMLHELGANVIWYDKHDDLPTLLKKL